MTNAALSGYRQYCALDTYACEAVYQSQRKSGYSEMLDAHAGAAGRNPTVLRQDLNIWLNFQCNV